MYELAAEMQDREKCCVSDQQDRHGCHCIPQETTIRNVWLATAYVAFQKFCGNMPPLESLIYGTVFAELVSPYWKREYANLEKICPCPGHMREGGYDNG